MALIAAVAERQSVRLFSHRGTTLEISVAFLPFVFTAVAFGPLAAFIVGAVANLADFRRPYMRWAVYTPVRALTGAATGLAAGALTTSQPISFSTILLATFFAALAHVASDAALNFGTLLIRRPTSPLMYVRAMTPHFFVAVPLYVPVVASLVYGYEKYSLVAIGAFLLPVVALQRVIHLYQEQREVAIQLAEVNQVLERANLSFASALVATLDARDRYTAGHSAAVARYSRDIAKRMDLTLQIHDRDAHDDVVQVLREEGTPERVVFHCYSGDEDLARICNREGWFMSFAGTLTFKNAAGLRASLAVADPALVLVETDSTFLTPHPHRGRPNASYMVPYTVRAMAELTNSDLARLCTQISENTVRAYGSWD